MTDSSSRRNRFVVSGKHPLRPLDLRVAGNPNGFDDLDLARMNAHLPAKAQAARELGLVPDPAFVANVHVHRVERGADAGSSRIDDELRTREEELSAASSGLSRRRRLRSTAPGQAPDAAGQRRLPFLFAAVAFNAATRAFGFFKRHYAAIQVGLGVVLVAVGYLVLTGELLRLNIEAGTSSASTAAHADVLPPTPCSSACVPGASATLRLRT